MIDLKSSRKRGAGVIVNVLCGVHMCDELVLSGGIFEVLVLPMYVVINLHDTRLQGELPCFIWSFDW